MHWSKCKAIAFLPAKSTAHSVTERVFSPGETWQLNTGCEAGGVLTERQTERRAGPQPGFYLLVLLLNEVWGLLKLMFSYTLDESSFVILQKQRRRSQTWVVLSFWDSLLRLHVSTHTEEEREDTMLDLDLELVIWGYLILEYSLSFILFLCEVTTHSVKQTGSSPTLDLQACN